MPERASKSRQDLIAAATRILAANPGASLAEVATRAGVGRATLYRHFPSREELIRELTVEAIRATDEAVAPLQYRAISATAMLREVIAAVVPLGDRYHFLSQEHGFPDDPEIEGELQRQLQELGDLVEAVKAERTIAAEMPTAWVVAAFDALIYAAWAAVNDGSVARRDAPELVWRTVISGLGPGKS